MYVQYTRSIPIVHDSCIAFGYASKLRAIGTAVHPQHPFGLAILPDENTGGVAHIGHRQDMLAAVIDSHDPGGSRTVFILSHFFADRIVDILTAINHQFRQASADESGVVLHQVVDEVVVQALGHTGPAVAVEYADY